MIFLVITSCRELCFWYLQRDLEVEVTRTSTAAYRCSQQEPMSCHTRFTCGRVPECEQQFVAGEHPPFSQKCATELLNIINQNVSRMCALTRLVWTALYRPIDVRYKNVSCFEENVFNGILRKMTSCEYHKGGGFCAINHQDYTQQREWTTSDLTARPRASYRTTASELVLINT